MQELSHNRDKFRDFAFCIVFLAICSSAPAAVWTNLVSGNASGNWNNNANWDTGVYPNLIKENTHG
jgi:hypothetical protein